MSMDRIQHFEIARIVLACMAVCVGISLSGFLVSAAQLSQQSSQAFDQYVRGAEARYNEDLAAGRSFLWIDRLSHTEKTQDYARLHSGEILIRQGAASNCQSLQDALIHDWIGAVFVPGASLSQTLAILQDYNNDAAYYPEQVVQSKLIAQTGNDFHLYLRLKQTELITIVLDTEYHVHYTRIDRSRVYSRSYSTRIGEVENAGTPREHVASAKNDHGFLWRLNSYWRFYEAGGGVYIQCEAISLTRDVPTGLGWLIGRFIEKIPARSLRSTLSETRRAILFQIHQQKEKTK